MKKDTLRKKCDRRFNKLVKNLGETGYILPGSIHKRIIEIEAAESSEKKKTRGPYYQWTWKKKGKTITVNLSEEQAEIYQQAIDNQRKVESIIKEMRNISLEILENTTTSVKRRKNKKIEL
jgi:hypothetical protein